MILRNLKIAYGESLALQEGYIKIDEDVISAMGRGGEGEAEYGEPSYDCEGLLALPGFINAHIHIGDSVAKDAGIGLPFNEIVHPLHGLKSKVLASTPKADLIRSMKTTLSDIMSTGITTIADFREGGLEGISSLFEASRDSDLRVIALGRPSLYSSEEEVSSSSSLYPQNGVKEGEAILTICQGFGLSGPNEYSDGYLRRLSEIAKAEGKMVAIHAAESLESVTFSLSRTGKTEVQRAVEELNPNFLVHLTNSRDEDLRLVRERKIPVVCCSRANASVGVGIPKLGKMLNMGITVAIGTDNVMIAAPDPFKEMEFAWRASLALEGSAYAISPIDVLKMMTINGAKALKMERSIGSIDVGKISDLVFIDMNAPNLESTRDPLSAVIHRARKDNVKAVMIGGKLVYGALEDL